MKSVSVDVGGTFTDCLVLEEGGGLRQFKAPTTPRAPAKGVLDALSKAARHFNQELDQLLAEVDVFIHGTTLATNTLLTGSGARTGMITTKNFRDVIHIRRGIKNLKGSMFDLFIPPYEPLVPRYLRLGVEERTLYTGEIITPLNERDVEEAVENLKARGVESIAVCFLHSYANPTNEQHAARICRESGDGIYVTTSSETLSVIGEFERFSTTVVGAHIGPAVADYLVQLDRELKERRFQGTLLLMLANGLVQTLDQCIGRAVYLLGSGPAAAPSGAVHLGRESGVSNILSVDMGGTSLDICLIQGGEIPSTNEGWVGEERVAIKMVDMHSVGAGGGSIAWVDSLGLLRVGPKSAGADPGPACYGKGSEATVTDADVVMGYIPDDYFLGGEVTLHRSLAEKAIQNLANELGMTMQEAAEAIFDTVNGVMADKITEISTKRGHDIRDFTMVAGGGASGVHAAFIAGRLGTPEVIVPSISPVYSAFGMFALDLGRDYARSFPCLASSLDTKAVGGLYRELEDEAKEAFGEMDIPPEEVRFHRTAELRYVGQFHQVEIDFPLVEVDFPEGEPDESTAVQLSETFHRRHKQLYTFSMPWQPVEILTFRLKATVLRPPVRLAKASNGGRDAKRALKRHRECWFEGSQVDTPVYDGPQMLAGNRIEGPAVIEEPATTIVVPPGFECLIDELKGYHIRKSRES